MFYNLDVFKDGAPKPTAASETDSRFFRTGVTTKCLSSTTFKLLCERYKWVKINSISYYWRIGYVTYDNYVEWEKVAVKGWPGINSLSNNIPFKLAWDLDEVMDEIEPTNDMDMNMNARVLYTGSKKAGVFKYRPPILVKQYLLASKFKDRDWINNTFKANMTSILGGRVASARIPEWFNGTISKVIGYLKMTGNAEKKIPINLVLYGKCYVNCTFAGGGYTF